MRCLCWHRANRQRPKAFCAMLRWESSILNCKVKPSDRWRCFKASKANDTLAEVYRTTTDPKIKKSIISAMFITKDAPRMVEMARNEKDLELKRAIVSAACFDERQSSNQLHDGTAQVIRPNQTQQGQPSPCVMSGDPMRIFLRLAIAAVALSATNVLLSQQPTILHGQVTTRRPRTRPGLGQRQKSRKALPGWATPSR